MASQPENLSPSCREPAGTHRSQAAQQRDRKLESELRETRVQVRLRGRYRRQGSYHLRWQPANERGVQESGQQHRCGHADRTHGKHQPGSPQWTVGHECGEDKQPGTKRPSGGRGPDGQVIRRPVRHDRHRHQHQVGQRKYREPHASMSSFSRVRRWSGPNTRKQARSAISEAAVSSARFSACHW